MCRYIYTRRASSNWVKVKTLDYEYNQGRCKIGTLGMKTKGNVRHRKQLAAKKLSELAAKQHPVTPKK